MNNNPESPMQAFHNDPAIKQKYLVRVRAHRVADNLVRGTGWENGRGCAIGCTLETYDHSRYPIELGLPEWLARLEDSIFEGLPLDMAMAWPESFLEAITPGANVEPVRHLLAIRRIDRLLMIQRKAAETPHAHGASEAITQTITALLAMRACHDAEAQGLVCDIAAAESAAWAAESAAWAAESAARSAAESAARSAARSAAWAAESAARSARSAWIAEASDLLELLRECAK